MTNGAHKLPIHTWVLGLWHESLTGILRGFPFFSEYSHQKALQSNREEECMGMGTVGYWDGAPWAGRERPTPRDGVTAPACSTTPAASSPASTNTQRDVSLNAHVQYSNKQMSTAWARNYTIATRVQLSNGRQTASLQNLGSLSLSINKRNASLSIRSQGKKYTFPFWQHRAMFSLLLTEALGKLENSEASRNSSWLCLVSCWTEHFLNSAEKFQTTKVGWFD